MWEAIPCRKATLLKSFNQQTTHVSINYKGHVYDINVIVKKNVLGL